MRQGKLVLLNGFVKKTQKTPGKEIDKASGLMNNYYEEKQETPSQDKLDREIETFKVPLSGEFLLIIDPSRPSVFSKSPLPESVMPSSSPAPMPMARMIKYASMV